MVNSLPTTEGSPPKTTAPIAKSGKKKRKRKSKKNTGNARRRKKLRKLLQAGDAKVVEAQKRHLELQRKQRREKQKRKEKLARREKLRQKEARLSPEQLATRVDLNNKISQFARRKQLSEAENVFKEATKLGLANSYTFASLMNAKVRCGDIRGAVALLRHPDANTGVVGYTTCIRGLFDVYDLSTASTILGQMQKAGVQPNLRTANTFLRGCLSTGSVDVGINCYRKMEQVWKVTPDASSHEYAVGLLCQGLRVDEAIKLANASSQVAQCDKSSIVSMWLHIARAAALCGRLKEAESSLEKASAAITEEECEVKASEEGKGQDIGNKKGGKRGKHSSPNENYSAEEIAARAKSQQIFADHRRNVAREGIQNVREHLKTLSSASESNLVENDIENRLVNNLLRLIAFTSRKKNLGDAERAPKPFFMKKSKEKVSSILNRMKRNFGIGQGNSILSTDAWNALENRFGAAFDAKGFLSLPTLLDAKEQSIPIKLEICSGDGDWIRCQARKDEGKSLWAAIEIRQDRCSRAWSHSCFGTSQKNLAILAGDAMEVLPDRFASETVSKIFVNHPEPPQQRNYDRTTEARHLVTTEFLQSLHRVLTVNGTIAITTDNLWYARLLKDIVTQIGPDAGENAHFEQPKLSLNEYDKYTHADEDVENESIHLFCGKPGEACGAPDPTASSYFDKLKRKEKDQKNVPGYGKKTNYFLYLKKVKKGSLGPGNPLKMKSGLSLSSNLGGTANSTSVAEPKREKKDQFVLRVAGKDATARLRGGGTVQVQTFSGTKITFDD
eukprot:g5598.t1